MKYTIALLLIIVSLAATAQTTSVTKSINDNGGILRLKYEALIGGRSINYENNFNVNGWSKKQKDFLVNAIIDSLQNTGLKTSGSTSNAAPAEKSLITAAVMDYVDAFYFGDTLKLIRSISPEVVKYGYYRKKDETTYAGEPMSYKQMMDYALRVKARNNAAAAEKLPKKVEVLDYQDQTASAKITAWWGTDYVLLGKHNGKWMITHVLWQSSPVKQ